MKSFLMIIEGHEIPALWYKMHHRNPRPVDREVLRGAEVPLVAFYASNNVIEWARVHDLSERHIASAIVQAQINGDMPEKIAVPPFNMLRAAVMPGAALDYGAILDAVDRFMSTVPEYRQTAPNEWERHRKGKRGSGERTMKSLRREWVSLHG